MLKFEDLKVWLPKKELVQQDKLLLLLATLDKPSQVRELKQHAEQAGFRIPAKWNISQILSRSSELAIRVPDGWEITEAGKLHLRKLGATKVSPAAMKVAIDLRAHLAKIKNADTRAFVEEAIKCHESDLHRAAIIMSWLSAMDILHGHVVTHHLAPFNAEAKRIDSKWKDAKSKDDLGRMKEADFLDRLVSISVIGKNSKAELKGCLDRRNGCGHPNSLKIGANTVAHHIEILLLNVFEIFQ